MIGITEHIESEELLLVFGSVTVDKSLCDLTAFYQSCQADQLAELAFQIELVSLVGNKIDVAFASVEHVQEFRNVDVV